MGRTEITERIPSELTSGSNPPGTTRDMNRRLATILRDRRSGARVLWDFDAVLSIWKDMRSRELSPGWSRLAMNDLNDPFPTLLQQEFLANPAVSSPWGSNMQETRMVTWREHMVIHGPHSSCLQHWQQNSHWQVIYESSTSHWPSWIFFNVMYIMTYHEPNQNESKWIKRDQVMLHSVCNAPQCSAVLWWRRQWK